MSTTSDIAQRKAREYFDLCDKSGPGEDFLAAIIEEAIGESFTALAIALGKTKFPTEPELPSASVEPCTQCGTGLVPQMRKSGRSGWWCPQCRWFCVRAAEPPHIETEIVHAPVLGCLVCGARRHRSMRFDPMQIPEFTGGALTATHVSACPESGLPIYRIFWHRSERPHRCRECQMSCTCGRTDLTCTRCAQCASTDSAQAKTRGAEVQHCRTLLSEVGEATLASVQNPTPALHVYLWTEVLEDYSYGQCVVVATDVRHARRLVWAYLQKTYGWSDLTKDAFRLFLQQEPTVIGTEPGVYACHGGG